MRLRSVPQPRERRALRPRKRRRRPQRPQRKRRRQPDRPMPGRHPSRSHRRGKLRRRKLRRRSRDPLPGLRRLPRAAAVRRDRGSPRRGSSLPEKRISAWYSIRSTPAWAGARDLPGPRAEETTETGPVAVITAAAVITAPVRRITILPELRSSL